MDLGFHGATVLITGGASHIGRGIVLAFAAEGARVALADIDLIQAERTARLAREGGASEVAVFEVDVSDDARVRTLVEDVGARMGTPQVLVNNAGWTRLMMPFAEQSVEHWRRLIAVNLASTISCTQAVLPGMVAAGRGAIVSISSEASFGVAREPVYGAAKAGVNTFMKSIAKEYGPYGIRCNVVSPGVVPPRDSKDLGEMSLWASGPPQFTAEQLDKAQRAVPLRRLGTPQDVANAVLFFASHKMAAYVSGQVMGVSGGA